MYNNKWNFSSSNLQIVIANSGSVTEAAGVHYADIYIKDRFYEEVKFVLMPNLCTNMILGHDFLSRHTCVEIPFGGLKSSMTVSPWLCLKFLLLHCLVISTQN